MLLFFSLSNYKDNANRGENKTNVFVFYFVVPLISLYKAKIITSEWICLMRKHYFCSNMEKIIRDNEFGDIFLRTGRKYKRCSLRVKDGKIYATKPYYIGLNFILNFINDNRSFLRKAIAENPKRPKQSAAQIEMMRSEAKKILPLRLEELASQFGFKYNSIHIRNMHSRWGSCSSRKNVNLSLWLVKLPQHLIDFVLLHELCHTIEMNHGERFHNLLNNVTQNREKELRKELRQYHCL